MAMENVIYGRMHTPEDENGERQIVLLETDIDHVKDYGTGKTLREILSSQSLSNATETESGLMSAEDKKTLDNLNNDRIIISTEDPGVACMWYQVLSEDS